MNKIYKLILSAVLVLTPVASLGVSASVSALAPNYFAATTTQAKNDACAGVNQLSDGTTSCGTANPTDVNSLVQTVIKVLSLLVGVISVFFLIFAGFRFITSGGDQNTVNSARNMILYAVIGIAIVVLAQLIVHITIDSAATANNL